MIHQTLIPTQHENLNDQSQRRHSPQMKNNRPVQRTLKYCREKMGMSAGVVERLLPRPGSFPIRKDYLGFIDIIAVGNGRVLGIQCTTENGLSAHKKKIHGDDLAEDLANWLSVAELEIWVWPHRSREPTISEINLGGHLEYLNGSSIK